MEPFGCVYVENGSVACQVKTCYPRIGDARLSLRLGIWEMTWCLRCMMIDADGPMRMTILIDGDVLNAAKPSGVRGTEPSVKLCRSWRAICCEAPAASSERNAVPLLSVRKSGVIVTAEILNVFRDEPS